MQQPKENRSSVVSLGVIHNNVVGLFLVGFFFCVGSSLLFLTDFPTQVTSTNMCIHSFFFRCILPPLLFRLGGFSLRYLCFFLCVRRLPLHK